jgi:PAS domain-containing protein
VVFDTITDAVVVRDPLARVVDVNPAAERLLGRRLAEMIGRTLAELEPAARGAAGGVHVEDHLDAPVPVELWLPTAAVGAGGVG